MIVLIMAVVWCLFLGAANIAYGHVWWPGIPCLVMAALYAVAAVHRHRAR